MGMTPNDLKTIARGMEILGRRISVRAKMSILGNRKTGKSLEGQRCPMMKIHPKGYLVAPKCPSCYAVACLNNHPAVRKFIERENMTAGEVVMRAAGFGCSRTGVSVLPGQRLRVYGLTDWSPVHLPMLRTLSKIYKLDVISKTLWMGDRKWLLAVASLPNVNISLSFNKEMPHVTEKMADVREFINKHKLTNVGLNYTFTSSHRFTGKSTIETYRRIPGVAVYHTTQLSKEHLAKVIGDRGVCGILDEKGKRIDTSKRGTHVSCLK